LDDGLNVLHLLNVDHNVSGEVKCRVARRNNPQIFNVYHTTLTVLPLPINERFESIEHIVESGSNKSSVVHDLTAYIIKRPDDQTVLVGDSIQLDVTYIGVPEPTVRWMRAVSFPLLSKLLLLLLLLAKCNFSREQQQHVSMTIHIVSICWFLNIKELSTTHTNEFFGVII